MTTSTPTTAFTDVRADVHAEFEKLARASFVHAMSAMEKAEFFKTVLRRLDEKTDITDEVPEIVGMDEKDVRDVVQSLLNKSKNEMTQTWELAAHYQPCFLTTVRSVTPTDEVLPQYEVEYAGKDDYAGAKVKVTTMRSQLKVEVLGAEKEVETLWLHMSHAAMMAS